jgi:putative SOS response-associated peptidase YedK
MTRYGEGDFRPTLWHNAEKEQAIELNLTGATMCGRFNLIADGAEIAEAFALAQTPEVVARYNIAPTQPVAAVRLSRQGERELTHFHWGLIPSWARDTKLASRMINARAETVAEKPSYRSAFKRRRCLLPATGFYEWQKLDGKKQPMHIHAADNAMLALAGLWEYWQGADGSEIESCTIITRDANEMMRPIHNRMPLIVGVEDYDLWLDPAAPLPAVQALLQMPVSNELLHASPITTYVNSPFNEGPGCIEPAS